MILRHILWYGTNVLEGKDMVHQSHRFRGVVTSCTVVEEGRLGYLDKISLIHINIIVDVLRVRENEGIHALKEMVVIIKEVLSYVLHST